MSKFNRRGRLLILLIIVSLVLQGSYTATGDELPQGGKYGGTLKVALKSEIMNLNPLTVTDSQVWKVIDIVYDSLFRLKTAVNGSIFPEPWLTESWEVLDNNTVVVELKQGVMWHDSTDVLPHYVTADDVIYTFTSSGGMKDSTKYGTMLTGISAFKTSPTNDYSVTFDLTNFDNKGIFFTRVLTVPLIPFGFGSTEFERGCGPFKYFSLVSAPNAVTDEILISGALGDEPRASLRHRNVSGVVVRLDSSVWPSSNYILHSRSGVVEFVTSPPVTSNITADYQYVDNRLVLEAFEDYHNGRPYLNNIEYTFYIDDPSSEYFDEGVDQAVIELIRKDVDLIGFEIGPADVSADRYYYDEDEGVSIKTKLSDETWKLVESFDNRTYDDPLTTPDEAEAAAYAYMRGFPKRTLKKVMIWTVEENITGEWTVVAIFDSEYECEQYKAGEIEDHPEKDGKLRTTFVWDVVEFFLALEETAGFNVLYLGINTQAVPLNDRQFRFALANLMDRNTQLSLLCTGRDTGYSIMIPEDSYWYNDSIPTYKLERNKENQPVYDNVSQVLMQAGYHDVAGAPFGGSDGYMDLPTGQVFSLNLLIPPIDLNSVESSIGSTIFQQLNGIGIN
ncbi:MAG: hypothetical protein KAI64_05280, partial [Thermoplasmata archaeon]|nr:hypothetical protein [Thermoplasmata archaeon]